MNTAAQPTLYKLFIVSLLLGVLIGFPNVIKYASDQDVVALNISFDETMYAMKIHYFSLTNEISSPYTLSDSIPIALFGIINKLAPIDILFIIVPFILIPLLFLSMYKFLRGIGLDYNVSILGSVSMILLSRIFYYLPTIHYSYLETYFFYLRTGGYYARFPEVMFSGIIFFTSLVLIYRQCKSRYTKYILSGILIGIMNYTYFYYGSFLLVFAFISGIILKNIRLIKSAVVGCIISIPVIYTGLTSPAWVGQVMGVGVGISIPQISLVLAIGVLAWEYADKFVASVIFASMSIETFAWQYLPQADHYREVIATSFIIIAPVMILSKSLSTRSIRVATVLILLLAVVQQASYVSNNSAYTENDILTPELKRHTALDSRMPELLYGAKTSEVYPVLMLRNTPEQIVSAYNLTPDDLTDNMVRDYVYHFVGGGDDT